jgi:PAS domain-containing protein
MGDGYALTIDGTVQAVNAQLCRLTGSREDELVGAGAPLPFWPPEL